MFQSQTGSIRGEELAAVRRGEDVVSIPNWFN